MARISHSRIDYSRVQLSKADIERLNKIVENSRSHGNEILSIVVDEKKA